MKVSAIAFLFFIALVPLMFAQKVQDSSARDFKLSVDVDLVIFNVTVTDSKGR